MMRLSRACQQAPASILSGTHLPSNGWNGYISLHLLGNSERVRACALRSGLAISALH